jgi:hypothetical protein
MRRRWVQFLTIRVDALFAGACDEKLRRVIEFTYFRPAPKQEVTAQQPSQNVRRRQTFFRGRTDRGNEGAIAASEQDPGRYCALFGVASGRRNADIKADATPAESTRDDLLALRSFQPGRPGLQAASLRRAHALPPASG